MENQSFFSVFGEIPGGGQAAAAFSHCGIDNIKIYMESRKMELHLSFSVLVFEKDIAFVENWLKEKLNLDSAVIVPKM